MRRATAIILFNLVAQAHCEEKQESKEPTAHNPGDAQDDLFNQMVGILAERLFSRAVEVPHLHHVDLDDAAFGKCGHLATPASQFSLHSTFSRPPCPTSGVPLRFSSGARFRSVPSVMKTEPSFPHSPGGAYGPSEQKKLKQQVLAEPAVAASATTATMPGQPAGATASAATMPGQVAGEAATMPDQRRSGGQGQNPFAEIGRLWLEPRLGKEEIPVAQYTVLDAHQLFSGTLFLVLQRFMEQYGSVYLLPTGLTSSFMVLSSPADADHVLNSYSKYEKGLFREISEFLFGDGFAISDGKPWLVRRRAVAPSLHKKYLDKMVQNVFAKYSMRTADMLAAKPGQVVNMEKIFSELTLDIIGKAVFNYDLKSTGQEEDNPVVQAVYAALKETEARSLDLLPIWKIKGDLPTMISPRQKRAADAVAVIRKTTEDLIENCRLQLEAEEAAGIEESKYFEKDDSVLRFLINSREEVRSTQLRDDLLSMLVAGHETTGSVMTWTLYLLTKNPEKMAKVQEEIDTMLGDKIKAGNLTMADVRGVNYLRWCVAESMRVYPHPPVLIRRALEDDVLPSGSKVPKGQDMIISVYNIHHSESFWPNPDDFEPERWSAYNTPRDNPNEKNTNFRYIPFSGGCRKCVGDQFALLETYVALSVLLYKFDFQLVKDQKIGMTTGATIHTTNGMMMTYTPRNSVASPA